MTTGIDESAHPASPPPIPPIVAPAPRPLGVWRALAWFGLASIAALALPVGGVIAVGMLFPLPEWHDDTKTYLFFAGAFAGFIPIIVIACRRSGWRAVDYLALTRPRGPFVRLAVLAFVVTLAVSLAVVWFGPESDDASPESVAGLVILLIAYIVVAPVGEELVFRGYLLRALADSRVGPVGAILVTALVWASLHFDKPWLGMADTFFSGLVWGWLRWRTQSTLPTIAVHVLTNLVASSGFVAVALGVS